MNVLIVDSNYKGLLPQEEVLKKMVDPQCSVSYLSASSPPVLETGCRGILISNMTYGVKAYQRELILSNPQVRCWVIVALDIQFASEQDQLVDSVNTALADCKAPYCLLFDDSKTLAKTAGICALPVNLKKKCLVVSASQSLAQKCRDVISMYLEGWEVVAASENAEQQYGNADIILAVGEKESDYCLPAPKYGMGKQFAWIGKEFEGADKRDMIYRTLTKAGWNLCSARNVYSGSLDFEEYSWQFTHQEISISTLKSDENFAIWDIYGLPLLNRDYTEPVIRSFLERMCCFGDLTERF